MSPNAVFAMFVAAFALSALAADSAAAVIAFDTAGDSAYNDSSPYVAPGVGGGYGWGSTWLGFDQVFIESSSTNGNADPNRTGDINSPRTPLGRAWGIRPGIVFARSAIAVFYAARQFDGTLDPGQTFSIDFDNGSVNGSNYAAVGLFSGPIQQSFDQGGAYYIYTYGGDYLLSGNPIGSQAPVDTGLPTTYDGLHIALTITGATDASISLTSISSGTSVTFAVPYSPVSEFAVANQDEQFGPAHDVYFNNISITPEPSTAGSCALAAFVALLLKRRRKKLPG